MGRRLPRPGDGPAADDLGHQVPRPTARSSRPASTLAPAPRQRRRRPRRPRWSRRACPPHALSVAQEQPRRVHRRELARVPAKRITRLRGIGSVPRYELVRRSREWRQRFNLPEAGLPRADTQWPQANSTHPCGQFTGPGFGPAAAVARPAAFETAADLAQLSVDEVIRKLIPDAPELARSSDWPAPRRAPPFSPWAGQQEIARATGMPTPTCRAPDRLRTRWAKSVPALTPVRDDLVEILREHGGVMGGGTRRGLLARRGSELGDPAERLGRGDLRARRDRHRGTPGEPPAGPAPERPGAGGDAWSSSR